MIIQQDILAFLWNMGEVQIDEFEVFEGKEQNKIEKTIAQSENITDRSK